MSSHRVTAQVGYTTSLDIAKKQDYATYRTIDNKRKRLGTTSQPASSLDRPVFNEIPLNTENGFKRPRIESAFEARPRLVASDITTVEDSTQKLSEYTQRKIISSTPGISQNPLLSLSHPSYGLPKSLTGNLAALGIRCIYPWQQTCLMGRGFLSGEKNLVYTAPTGGGKSLVADILMLKRVIDNQKALLVLPYVALVQEKLKWLRRVVEGVTKKQVPADEPQPTWRRNKEHSSIRVVGFFGGSKARATWGDIDIAICTIEKANSLINTAIEDGDMGNLAIVVLDELHMIDDEHRGFLMELTATKLLTIRQDVQIVGMSATLSASSKTMDQNTELLAEWLGAKFYVSNYKPVPIEEYLVYDSSIYTVSTSKAFLKTATQLNSSHVGPNVTPVRQIAPSKHNELKKPSMNAVVSLTIETARSGYGALVFCSSRQACQTVAMLISDAMPPAQEMGEDILDRRKEVLSKLRSTPIGLDDALKNIIIRGVAFHHAGLTTEERDIVAVAYEDGAIKVIVATCSLAAGINLPARRVILNGARMGRDLVGPAMLRQMRGRAGRKGKDEIGESYVCCEKDDLEEVAQLLEAEMPPVESSLTPGKQGIKRALLEVVAIQLATHSEAIQDYVQRTLLHHTMDRTLLAKMVEESVKDLCTCQLLAIDQDGTYTATLLGQAIVASSLSVEDGIFVHADFQRALQSFVMDGEMHVFYMFTPVQPLGLGNINWAAFRTEMDRLDESGLRVLTIAGIKPFIVNRMAMGGLPLPENTTEEIEMARIYRRFYTAFQLRDLCNEVPVHAVARKYDVPRGSVQSLVQVCEGFAAGMIKFCERMQWGMLQSVLEHMRDRLKAGARADLLELAKIPFVKSRTARLFWENGMKSLRAVAAAEVKDVVPILLLAQPKKSKINGDEEAKYHEKLVARAEIIVAAASRLWEREQQIDIVEADI